MINLVLKKDGIYVEDVCVAKFPIARLGSPFISAVPQIPVAWKHLAKVWCFIVLAGSTYLCYKIYWHFCNRTSLNRHLQGSEWIELNKDVIIEVVEEPRLENNLPHSDASRNEGSEWIELNKDVIIEVVEEPRLENNLPHSDASRNEHSRIMKIARILVRRSMAGSQLNENIPQINLQIENSSLVLPMPMAVDPSDISDTVQPTTSTAISTLEVPVTIDPSDISDTVQPTTSTAISTLEVPVTIDPSDISDTVQPTTSTAISTLEVPVTVDPSDISDTVQPSTSTAISTLVVPVTVDPSDRGVCNDTLQPTISILEPPVPMTEPSDICVRNDALQSKTSASILNEIGEPVRLSDVSEGVVCSDHIHIEFPKALDSLQIITKFISGKYPEEEPISAYALRPIELMDIKDDIFSPIRAVLLQSLMCQISLLQRIGGARCLVQKFETWQNGQQDWLKSWKFHDAESSSFSCFYHICFTCLGTLHKLEEGANIERKSFLTLACADRVDSTVSKLLEAVKLIMMASAIELFEQQTNFYAVPTFSALLFSREATLNPKSLMLNHFNLLGHTEECLEEIDYYLLGYSLKETITIIRPHLYGTKDFVKHYPECMIGFWPEIVVFVDQEGRYSIRGN